MSDIVLRETLVLILQGLSMSLKREPRGPHCSALLDEIANKINELGHHVPAGLAGERPKERNGG